MFCMPIEAKRLNPVTPTGKPAIEVGHDGSPSPAPGLDASPKLPKSDSDLRRPVSHRLESHLLVIAQVDEVAMRSSFPKWRGVRSGSFRFPPLRCICAADRAPESALRFRRPRTQTSPRSSASSTPGSRTSTQRPSMRSPAIRCPVSIIAMMASVNSYSPRGDFTKRAV